MNQVRVEIEPSNFRTVMVTVHIGDFHVRSAFQDDLEIGMVLRLAVESAYAKRSRDESAAFLKEIK